MSTITLLSWIAAFLGITSFLVIGLFWLRAWMSWRHYRKAFIYQWLARTQRMPSEKTIRMAHVFYTTGKTTRSPREMVDYLL